MENRHEEETKYRWDLAGSCKTVVQGEGEQKDPFASALYAPALYAPALRAFGQHATLHAAQIRLRPEVEEVSKKRSAFGQPRGRARRRRRGGGSHVQRRIQPWQHAHFRLVQCDGPARGRRAWDPTCGAGTPPEERGFIVLGVLIGGHPVHPNMGERAAQRRATAAPRIVSPASARDCCWRCARHATPRPAQCRPGKSPDTLQPMMPPSGKRASRVKP